MKQLIICFDYGSSVFCSGCLFIPRIKLKKFLFGTCGPGRGKKLKNLYNFTVLLKTCTRLWYTGFHVFHQPQCYPFWYQVKGNHSWTVIVLLYNGPLICVCMFASTIVQKVIAKINAVCHIIIIDLSLGFFYSFYYPLFFDLF